MRFIALGFALITICTGIHAKPFAAEGSDLLMGVGARAIAMSGAVSASSNDIYSIYWNPAGLSKLEHSEFSFSRSLRDQIDPVSFIGFAKPFKTSWFGGFNNAIGIAWVPRFHVIANGRFEKDDIANIFLQFSVPEIPEGFNGKINSKTRDTRLVFATNPRMLPKLSLGISLAWIKCISNFCGTSLNDPNNYQIATTDASAFALNLGLQYQINKTLRIAVNVKDINTTLNVETLVTDNKGVRTEKFSTAFPSDLTLGINWVATTYTQIQIDYQSLSGDYGQSPIDFRLLRTGIEYSMHPVQYRMGLLIPLKLTSGITGNIINDLPAPVAPTAGIGWKYKRLQLGLVLYANPIMSYQRQAVYPTAEASLSIEFDG